ncbi:esterase-like activity of phytase family protein [Acuticoccus sp. I52.16.1]|uniref:esterase-like activity of phytase family protein n=1 Tax=Acuticoccus sp. I52.16.1 TaxID=2928472 RepID=UPI001FD4DB4F|nr:esterase-like activity of phytase family protein [Acuticoccus sp. I52.16.1]UOM32785.1 esterase-like activity of phytase family protein [Acuticoccus sp. I52.16.1]
MRAARAAVAALLASAAVVGGAAADPATLRVRQILDFGGDAEANGRMTFLGGVVLSGPRAFGGWSGMLMDGNRFLAVSDTGTWMTGEVLLEEGQLVGVKDIAMYPRLDLHGRAITTKLGGDAEALTLVDGGVLVGVESSQQLLFYPANGIDVDFDAVPERLELDVPEIVKLRHYGFESLATRADGTVIAITEGRDAKTRELPAFRRPGAPFTIKRDRDWSVTGADMLPGGDMVLMERRYGGGLDVGMRVRRIGSDAVDSGDGPVDGPVLIEADFASEIDNMEAITATVEDGQVILTMLSDDNHAFLQRTLLLRFALRDPLPRPRPERDPAPERRAKSG